MSTTKEKLNVIEKYFRKSVSENNFSHLVATVSGGADSLAILSALCATGVRVTAAHCNFHLRGEESMRDQRHVEDICEKLKVNLEIKDFDVETYISQNKGTSAEMACRSLRYEWFYHLADNLKADRIVTGHNADDNIETLFLNLLRGSGTSGLRGMLPDNGRIWRPLLRFHRREIEQYLASKDITFITDSSNLTSDYRRNFLRNEIIPMLRQRWEGFDKALDRSVSLLRSENKVVCRMVADNLPEEGEPLDAARILNFPDPELLVRRYIEPLQPFTATASEIISAIRADKPDRKSWRLRRGEAILQNRLLRLKPDTPPCTPF